MKTPPGHLLVVDDDPMARMLLARSLVQAGHTVETAETGRHALELLRSGCFDAVLLDLLMPEMDGYQVLEQIVADDALWHVPVIMVSGFEEMAGVVTCMELGAEDFIHKPFDPALLRARIDNSLLKKRLLEREVSLRQQLEERYAQLIESERMRASLVDMIVHDLRTPLTALIGGLGTIGNVGELNPEQRECLDISIRGGEDLLDLINDLLDVSKMEAGSMKVDHQRIPAGNLSERAVGQVTQLARDRQLSLRSEVEPSAPLLWGDEAKLCRMLVNLLGNAIRFTPGGGSVTLRIRGSETRPEAVLSVTDTGEGIPREAFDRIFEKFGQVDSRTAGRTMSNGLGLTFCKMVAEAHGGRIWVESELGQGSTFSVALPLCPADLPVGA